MATSERTRKGTCDGCGKVRKLTYPADRSRDVFHHPDGRKKLLSSAEYHEATKQLIHYYGLCSECFPKVDSQDDIAALRRAREPKKRGPRFAYPCVGGPLDGDYATTEDFRGDGLYAHLGGQYDEFNAAGGGVKRIGGSPTMIFVHMSLLKPLISPRTR